MSNYHTIKCGVRLFVETLIAEWTRCASYNMSTGTLQKCGVM